MHACTRVTHIEENLMLRQAVCLGMMALTIYVLMISPALATSTPMGTVLCTIVDFIYGNLGRGLATLAIIVVGVGATLGKVSWGLAMTVAVGISVIFNAKWIANNMGLGAGGGCP